MANDWRADRNRPVAGHANPCVCEGSYVWRLMVLLTRLKLAGLIGTTLGTVMLSGCAKVDTTHKVETVSTVKIEPIYITIDIRIDRQLDQFFAFEDQLAPATQPTTQASTPATSGTPLRPVSN